MSHQISLTAHACRAVLLCFVGAGSACRPDVTPPDGPSPKPPPPRRWTPPEPLSSTPSSILVHSVAWEADHQYRVQVSACGTVADFVCSVADSDTNGIVGNWSCVCHPGGAAGVPAEVMVEVSALVGEIFRINHHGLTPRPCLRRDSPSLGRVTQVKQSTYELQLASCDDGDAEVIPIRVAGYAASVVSDRSDRRADEIVPLIDVVVLMDSIRVRCR